MVSSLIEPQYHDGKFWKFSKSSAAGSSNNFDVPVVPSFAADFEVSDQPRLIFVPHITNEDLDFLEILWFLVDYCLQHLVVHVDSINVVLSLKSLDDSDIHPFSESEFWCPDDIVTITIDSKRNCKFTIKWEDSRDTRTRSTAV